VELVIEWRDKNHVVSTSFYIMLLWWSGNINAGIIAEK
jgi:hypothetical protein